MKSMPSLQKPYKELDDEALIYLVGQKNHNAFTILVERHTTKSFSLALRTLNSESDAEDAIQSVFMRLWTKPNNWNADKSAFTTWLYRVVLNACYDIQRQSSRRSETSIEHSTEPVVADALDDVNSKFQELQQQKQLNLAIRSLPRAQQEALNLAVFLGMPQKQVASILGISLKAVESLLVRAKKSLKLYCSSKLEGE